MTELLPAGWAESSFGEAAEIQLGKMLDASRQRGTAKRRYLRNINVRWGQVDLTDLKQMDIPADEVDRYTVRAGDLVVCEGGEPGRCAIVPSTADGLGFQKALHRLRALGEVHPGYLALALRALASTGELDRHFTGSTIKHLTNSALKRVPLRVPPAPEQRRIADALGQAMSVVEQLRASTAGVAARIEAADRALVAAACTGALCGFDSQQWRESTVHDVGRVQLGRQRSPQYHAGPNMRPYLRVANVHEDRIDTSDVMSMDFDDEEFRKYELHAGDILLNEGQSPRFLGRPAMYRGEVPGAAFTNSLLRFNPYEGVLPVWALLVFRWHMHTGRFTRESRITTNIAHLSASRLKSVEFPVPPLEEQRELIAAYEAARSIQRQARAALEGVRERIRALEQSLLKAAVEGRLVPQDPNDEPASVLLDRLNAERASAAKEPSRRTVRGRAASAAADGGRKSA